MAISFVDSTVNSSTSNSVSVSKPVGTTTDDVMLACLLGEDGSSLPGGWTTAISGSFSDHYVRIGYKMATASEPSAYTFGGGGSGDTVIASIHTYRGADTGTPIEYGAAVQGNLSITGVPVNSAGAWLVYMGTGHDGAVVTTTGADVRRENDSESWGLFVTGYMSSFDSNGPVGVGTFSRSMTPNSNDRCLAIVVLREMVTDPAVTMSATAADAVAVTDLYAASDTFTAVDELESLDITATFEDVVDGFTVSTELKVVDVPFTPLLQFGTGTKYDLAMVARVPQPSGPPALTDVDEMTFVGLTYVDELSKPQMLDASVQMSTLTDAVKQRLKNPDELATEMWLYRDGRLVFAGPLRTWRPEGSGEKLTITAAGILDYTFQWKVWADPPLTFNGTDQALIVKALVDHWQVQDYGHFGIDTSNVTATGVLRDAIYLRDEDHVIGQRIYEMGQRSNGFDVEVDPATRMLRLWHPLQGVDRSSGEDAIVFDGRNVTNGNVMLSAATGDVASEAFGFATSQTTTGTLFSHRFNEDLRKRYGRTAVSATFDGVSEQNVLDDHTQALVDARSQVLLIPGPDTRVTPDSDLASYDVGDTVQYTLNENLGVTGAWRIRRRTVRVNDVGKEAVTLEFV